MSLPHVHPRIIEWGHGCRPGRINIISCSNNFKQVFIIQSSLPTWHDTVVRQIRRWSDATCPCPGPRPRCCRRPRPRPPRSADLLRHTGHLRLRQDTGPACLRCLLCSAAGRMGCSDCSEPSENMGLWRQSIASQVRPHCLNM